MTVANNNKKMLDLPFFELLNQIPATTTAITGLTTSESGADRFIYGMVGSAFYRYDTIGDTWQQLATPATAPASALTLRYTGKRGYHGRVLSANSSSVTIPGLRGSILDGEKISILHGPGAGQERTLTYVSETVHDAGVITGTTTSTLADSTKKWKVNQWAGYVVAITYGTGSTFYRNILYNDTNTLYVFDTNLQPHDPWNNQVFTATAPYAVPVTTAGSQAHYQIMSSTFNVDTNWTTTPDYTSYFTTLTGGIYLVSSATAAPFFTFQYYDVLNDRWQTKTVPQGLIGAALGTDFTIERTGRSGLVYANNSPAGTISGTTRTISDSGLTLQNDRYTNHRIYITGGTGVGQNRRIVAHTANTFTVARSWTTTPSSNSTFEIRPDSDRVFLAGGGASAMYAYSPDNDYWMQGQAFDDGVICNISATMGEWSPVGVSTGARIAAGVLAVNSTPTAAGSGYSIGDVLTCSVGGTGAQVIVNSITPAGGVTSISLVHTGTATGFTTGTGKATTGGTGSGCTIEITSVGPTALITTASAHWFKAGDTITFAGCSESAWNTTYTIIGSPSTTTFCVAAGSATASMAATASQSTSTVVDPTKNWIVNEHAGRLVHIMVAGQAPTSQIRWIVSNTATTLTLNGTITAGGNGTSKYVIYDSKIFGVDDQRKESDKKAYGWATSGSTTTLVDSTKNWVPNQWANYYFKIEAGTGYGSGRILITQNTENTLTFATQTFTPDSTTKYEIADTWGLATAGSVTSITEATNKNWTTNQWAGKRVRILSGTGGGQEATVTSSTATALTTGTITAPDTSSAYAIISIPPRSTGIDLIWTWGANDPLKKGRYIYSPRGGGTNTIDIYDITTQKWVFGIQFSPQSELFNTGSSYTYDGADTIYASRSVASAPIRIFELDIDKNVITGSKTTTFLQGTATIGNMMEKVTSPDGVDFLYVLQNTGTLFARAMIF